MISDIGGSLSEPTVQVKVNLYENAKLVIFLTCPKNGLFLADDDLQTEPTEGEYRGKAIHTPQYVERGGTLLVITKARLAPVQQDHVLSPWELRGKTLESFYDSTKTW